MTKVQPINIDKVLKLPVYAKFTVILVGFIALITILYIAADIIIPIVFALIIAILLHPVVKFLIKHKFNRVLAIIITLTVTILLISGVLLFLISQATLFSKSWPAIVNSVSDNMNQFLTWVSQKSNISLDIINEQIASTKKGLISNYGSEIGKSLLAIGNTLIIVFLVPVYIFAILYYEPILSEFIKKLFGKDNLTQVSEVMINIKTVIQRYLTGLLIEIGVVSALNVTFLLILGIEYAFLIGILGGLLNMIPYLGGLVAVALPMMIALATKDSAWYSVYVLVGYYIIQLIDNNILVPKIMASKVKINALFSIMIVIAGNALWGISGMFLSIPILAIIKLIFDHVEPLKPWGLLLGDNMPPDIKIKSILKKQKSNK